MTVKSLSSALRIAAFAGYWLDGKDALVIHEISKDLIQVNETLEAVGCPLPADNSKRTWQVAWSQFRFERRNQIPSLA